MPIDVKDRIAEGAVEIGETSMSMEVGVIVWSRPGTFVSREIVDNIETSRYLEVGAVLMCLRKSCRGLCP